MKYSDIHQDTPKDILQIISQAGRVQQEIFYRARNSVWPIDGGILEHMDNDNRDLLITG